MDYLKNKCPVCRKMFCCSSHRADHEVKHHSDMYPVLKQDFLVQLFKKRTENILLKSQHRENTRASKEVPVSNIQGISNSCSEEKHSNLRNRIKRTHSEINKWVVSESVAVSETRKILVPVRKFLGNNHSNHEKPIDLNHKSPNYEASQKTLHYDSNAVKTSTPILENLSKGINSNDDWDHISPASTISYYETPQAVLEEQRLLRSQPNKSIITPLRSIMAKSSRYVLDGDPSPNYFNSSKGRKVTFSFSSSRVSSTNSSPLESVQEIEFHEEIKAENREVRTTVSSLKCFNEKETTSGVQENENYVLEVTSTVNSCVKTKGLSNINITNSCMYREDSQTSTQGGGLFSCVTDMFCSAVNTFPLWRGSHNRSKRSRSPEREVENPIVQSPLPKRPCYPSDLRLNPIRARKPISQS